MSSPPSVNRPKTDAFQLSKKDNPDEANRKILKSGQGSEQMRFLPDTTPHNFDSSPTGQHRQHHRNFDINLYATKKSAAQGLLDLALLMANASQLKHIIMTDGDHRFYTAMIILLSSSIALQIVVAIGLLFLARIRIYDYATRQDLENRINELQRGEDETDAAATEKKEMQAEEERVQRKLKRADFLNNVTVAGIFILTVINVFISAFGLNESPRKDHAMRDEKKQG